MSTSYGARNYAGQAPQTTTTGSLTAGTTSFVVADGSGYPSTNFFIVLDRGLSTEEKCFVGSRSTNTFNSVSRGEDSTTATSHTTGATVNHTVTAQDMTEFNAMSSIMTAKGDLVTRTGSAGPAKLSVGADGSFLLADSAQTTGLNWSSDVTRKSTLTTTGDLYYASGASTPARLGVGATGAMLNVAGGVPTWLGVGSNGSVLKVASGAPSWLAPGTDGQFLGLASGAPTWKSPTNAYAATSVGSVANSVTTTKVAELQVPAGVVAVGDVYKLVFTGTFLQNSGVTPTVQLYFLIDKVAQSSLPSTFFLDSADTVDATMTSSANTRRWLAWAEVQIVALNANIFGYGQVQIGSATASFSPTVAINKISQYNGSGAAPDFTGQTLVSFGLWVNVGTNAGTTNWTCSKASLVRSPV